MNGLTYSEVQHFSKLRWLWVLLPGLIMTELIILVPEVQHQDGFAGIVLEDISKIPITSLRGIPILSGDRSNPCFGYRIGDCFAALAMSNLFLRWLLVILMVSVLLILLILFVFRYELAVDQSGVRFRFIPKLFKWKTIPFDQIQSYRINNTPGWCDKMQLGYSRNPFSKSEIINITGKRHLVITRKDGNVVKIGTDEPDTLMYILNRLMAPDNT